MESKDHVWAVMIIRPSHELKVRIIRQIPMPSWLAWVAETENVKATEITVVPTPGEAHRRIFKAKATGTVYVAEYKFIEEA